MLSWQNWFDWREEEKLFVEEAKFEDFSKFCPVALLSVSKATRLFPKDTFPTRHESYLGHLRASWASLDKVKLIRAVEKGSGNSSRCHWWWCDTTGVSRKRLKMSSVRFRNSLTRAIIESFPDNWSWPVPRTGFSGCARVEWGGGAAERPTSSPASSKSRSTAGEKSRLRFCRGGWRWGRGCSRPSSGFGRTSRRCPLGLRPSRSKQNRESVIWSTGSA